MNLNRSKFSRFWMPFGVACGLMATVSGCGMMSRVKNIGQEPPLTPIENPIEQSGYQPVHLPMPAPEVDEFYANSLWRAGARAFFKDQRASRVGDILTVLIDIQDSAQIENRTSRSRQNSENANFDGFLGFESRLDTILPDEVNPGNLIDIGSAMSNIGQGAVDRSESIELSIAAIVTQILPNGNLVITGRQEVRVNFEVRALYITGIVRPEDISATNIIRHAQIAEARISYGGRGQLTDVQQPRYGQQLFDIIFPF